MYTSIRRDEDSKTGMNSVNNHHMHYTAIMRLGITDTRNFKLCLLPEQHSTLGSLCRRSLETRCRLYIHLL